jgi:outer membrane lipoprotein SlyB
MKKLTSSLAIVGSVLLTACASQNGWAPTVDPMTSRNPQRINQDTAECRQLAGQASGSTARNTAVGVGVGGLIGAAGGAAIGAAVGSPGTGAAIGAAAGGIGGGAQQGFSSEADFKRAFNNCMRGRGHTVLN